MFANASLNNVSSACACAKSHAAAALSASSETRLAESDSAESDSPSRRWKKTSSSDEGVKASDKRASSSAKRDRRVATSFAASVKRAARSATRRAAAARRPACAKNEPEVVGSESDPSDRSSNAPPFFLESENLTSPENASERPPDKTPDAATNASGPENARARERASARLAASNGNQVVVRSTTSPPAEDKSTTNASEKCASTMSRMCPWSERSVSGAKKRHAQTSAAPRASSSASSLSAFATFFRNRRRFCGADTTPPLRTTSSTTKSGSPNCAKAPAPGTGRARRHRLEPDLVVDFVVFVETSATTSSHSGGSNATSFFFVKTSRSAFASSSLQRARCTTTRSRKGASRRVSTMSNADANRETSSRIIWRNRKSRDAARNEGAGVGVGGSRLFFSRGSSFLRARRVSRPSSSLPGVRSSTTSPPKSPSSRSFSLSSVTSCRVSLS